MKNNTNIYDIDGEIIRAAGDNHQWTIDEAKEKVQYYQNKIKAITESENPTEEDQKKLKIYENYCKNLMNFEWSKLMSMNQQEFTEYMAKNAPKQEENTTEEEVTNALNELKNDIETGEDTQDEVSEQPTTDNTNITDEEPRNDEAVERSDSDIHEERVLSQSDLLVERDNVNTVMDEYVDYEEID